ncbi:FMN-binding negative transcriptional regulator [Pseudonocardiaceae bacterium YIM PH 21723]|nr:FMN-binding negative transcriptional regulator [Pseudonocardiaceae bacterium YIM PH 21723]
MYTPTYNAVDEHAIRELLSQNGAADLITATEEGLLATMLPFVYDADRHVLRGHLARLNEQWKRPVLGEALVIVRGPDAYISPSWYPSKATNSRTVPTWNYVTANVYGRLTLHEDPAWLEAHVRELTDGHESGRPNQWSVDDAPPKFIAGQLRAIIGLELEITRIDARFKLSQNKSELDRQGVVDGLRTEGDHPSAQAVEQAARS